MGEPTIRSAFSPRTVSACSAFLMHFLPLFMGIHHLAHVLTVPPTKAWLLCASPAGMDLYIQAMPVGTCWVQSPGFPKIIYYDVDSDGCLWLQEPLITPRQQAMPHPLKPLELQSTRHTDWLLPTGQLLTKASVKKAAWVPKGKLYPWWWHLFVLFVFGHC